MRERAGGLFQHPMLLPARGQDRLHILWQLIDRLIPREASLLREPRHRLNQLIDLRAKQRLPIVRLNRLRSIGRTRVPVLDGNVIR
jgi:hypothetical protein